MRVFFERDPTGFKKAPDGSKTDFKAVLLCEHLTHLLKRHVGLFLDQVQKESFVNIKLRPARFALLPCRFLSACPKAPYPNNCG